MKILHSFQIVLDHLLRMTLGSLSLLLLAGLCVISCHQESPEPVDGMVETGIFTGDTLWIDDSIPAIISFSFDEQDDGSVMGGVMVLPLKPHPDLDRTFYMNEHLLTLWEEEPNGVTHISGTCDLQSDLGSLSFSGLLVNNSVYYYQLWGDHLSAEGEARRVAPYCRNDSTVIMTAADAAANNCTDYVGSYDVALIAPSNSFCSESGEHWTLKMVILATGPNGWGGLGLIGYLEGEMPPFDEPLMFYDAFLHGSSGLVQVLDEDLLMSLIFNDWVDPCLPMDKDNGYELTCGEPHPGEPGGPVDCGIFRFSAQY